MIYLNICKKMIDDFDEYLNVFYAGKYIVC